MPRGGSRAAAMGRAGTLRSVSQAIRDRRARKKEEAISEEAEKISSIRIPIGRAQPKAMPSSIGDAIEERKVQDEIATQPEAVAPVDQTVAQEQYEETNRAIQETKDLEVRAVDELPMMKQLEPYPSAKNRLMQLAEANGWVKMIGGVPTISNKQMKIAQGIIAGDLNLRKEMNELALNDITMNIASLQQAKLDPKLKEEDTANIDSQLEQLSVEQGNKLNAVNMMDREIQRKLATAKPTAPTAAPHKTKTEPLGKGKYQDWERVEGKWQKLGNPYEKGKGKGAGLSANAYRQWVRQAETDAYKKLFAQDETIMQEIAKMEATVDEDEKARIQAGIHRELTPKQMEKLSELEERYFRKKAPGSVLEEYLATQKRFKGDKAVTDPVGLR